MNQGHCLVSQMPLPSTFQEGNAASNPEQGPPSNLNKNNKKFLENYQYALNLHYKSQEWKILASQILAEIKSDSHVTNNWKFAVIKKTSIVYNGQGTDRN